MKDRGLLLIEPAISSFEIQWTSISTSTKLKINTAALDPTKFLLYPFLSH